MNPQELQVLVNNYKVMADAGEITKEEHVQLLTGINYMEGINDDAEGLILKEQINTILNAAISVASMAA
jgi:hypothetical protein